MNKFETTLPHPRYGGDRSNEIDLGNPMVAGIGDLEVASSVQRRPNG